MATNYNDVLKGDLQSTNWQAYINQAKAEGNMQAAAQLEQKRNEKIASKTYQNNGGKQTQTNNYSQYLPKSSSSSSGGSSGGKTYQSDAHKAAYEAAARNDWDAVGTAINQIAINEGKDKYGTYNMANANAYLKQLQDEFGYDANEYYRQKYDSVYGSGAWDSGTTGGSATNSAQTGGYGSFEDFMDDMGYNDMAEETRKAIQAAVNSAISGYRSQIDTTNRDTEELARQAYISKMMGEKNIEQQLAASGYAGGLADSHRIALEANYENDLNMLEQQRIATVQELERAITNAQLTGDMQTAQELSNYLAQIQGQWSSYVQNQQSMQNQNYWNQQQLNANNQSKAREWALTLIQGGSMPDDVTLTAAGMTREQAQALLGGLRKPVANPIARYDNGGLENSVIAAMQEAMGGVAVDGLWGPESQARAAALGYSTNPVEAYEQALGQNIPIDVLEALSRVESSGRNVNSRAAAVIENAIAGGKITEQQGVRLLAQYGL